MYIVTDRCSGRYSSVTVGFCFDPKQQLEPELTQGTGTVSVLAF